MSKQFIKRPNLGPKHSSYTYHTFFTKINANRRCKIRLKHTIRILEQKTRFSHTRIAKRQKFQQIIVLNGQTHFVRAISTSSHFVYRENDIIIMVWSVQ